MAKYLWTLAIRIRKSLRLGDALFCLSITETFIAFLSFNQSLALPFLHTTLVVPGSESETGDQPKQSPVEDIRRTV